MHFFWSKSHSYRVLPGLGLHRSSQVVMLALDDLLISQRWLVLLHT